MERFYYGALLRITFVCNSYVLIEDFTREEWDDVI